jgi:hypothetical protein
MTDDEIKEKIERELDKAELIWEEVKDKFILEKAIAYSGGLIPTKLPGFPFIENGRPKVGNFIALVLDIRGSTAHLLQAISPHKAKASQLQRVLYETTAVNTVGILITREKKGAITEFLGDGFLAFFKVEDEENPKEVYAAHHAAKRCISVISGIVNELLSKRYKLPGLEIGIGMAYSQALVTVIGIENDLHPKALGECVYRASKLSFGRNKIYIDARLEALWPTSKSGGIRFDKIDNKRVPHGRQIDFEGYVIERK